MAQHRILAGFSFSLILALIQSSPLQSSDTVQETEKPTFNFAYGAGKNSKTVYLNHGEQFQSKLDVCDSTTNRDEYCRVFLNGQPSTTITVERSNTIVTGHPRIGLVTEGNEPFINVPSNTSNVVIENLSINRRTNRSTNSPVILLAGSSISHVVVRNCHLSTISLNSSGDGDEAGAVLIVGTGRSANDSIRNVFVTENKISQIGRRNSYGVKLAGNIANWIVSWNKISNIFGNAIEVHGTYMRPTTLPP